MPFGYSRCPVLTGVGVGTTVLVWVDAAIFAARFQGYDGDNIALFIVNAALLRVPCAQIRAIFS